MLEGVSGITMHAGSKIEMNLNADSSLAPITLAGDASIAAVWGASDHQTDNLAAISGAHTLTINGFTVGLSKSIFFGLLIAGAGCLRGMQCGRSASAVGDAATSAVVTGIISIIVATAVITVITNVPVYLDRRSLAPAETASAVQECERAHDEEEKDARIHGRFVHLRGLVYKEFTPGVHTIPRFAITSKSSGTS